LIKVVSEPEVRVNDTEELPGGGYYGEQVAVKQTNGEENENLAN